MRVLFQVSRPSQITAMKAVLSGKETFGDEIHVSAINDGSYDLVITVKPEFKDSCLIFDHSGTAEKLGYPDDIICHRLLKISDNHDAVDYRIKQQDEEENLKSVKCPGCNFIKRPGVFVCPQCGFLPEGGTDVPTDRSVKLKSTAKKGNEVSLAEKQRWWSELKLYQINRALHGKPVKDGFCRATFIAKFGSIPAGLSNTPAQEISGDVTNYIKYRQIAWAKRLKK